MKSRANPVVEVCCFPARLDSDRNMSAFELIVAEDCSFLLEDCSSKFDTPPVLLTRVKLDPTEEGFAFGGSRRGSFSPHLGSHATRLDEFSRCPITIGHYVGNCVFSTFPNHFHLVRRRRHCCGENIPRGTFFNLRILPGRSGWAGQRMGSSLGGSSWTQRPRRSINWGEEVCISLCVTYLHLHVAYVCCM